MASSGKSLSYSRASAEDDEGHHSDDTRSRSGDNRDELRNMAQRMQPDPKERERYQAAAEKKMRASCNLVCDEFVLEGLVQRRGGPLNQ